MLKNRVTILLIVLLLAITISLSIGMVYIMQPKKPITGEFYSLQEAYEQGIIDKQALESIAYYNSGWTREGFAPIPKTPDILSEEVSLAIKKSLLKNLQEREYKYNGEITYPYANATLDDVKITGYYGTYGDCVAVLTDNGYDMHSGVMRYVEIDGVKIKYNNSNGILIWKEI